MFTEEQESGEHLEARFKEGGYLRHSWRPQPLKKIKPVDDATDEPRRECTPSMPWQNGFLSSESAT